MPFASSPFSSSPFSSSGDTSAWGGTGAAEITIQPPTVTSSGTVSEVGRAVVVIPLPTVSAIGFDPHGANAAVVAIPLPTVAASGGGGMVANIQLPTVVASGTVSSIASAVSTISLPTVLASGGGMGAARMPLPTVMASGTVTSVSRATIPIPIPTVTASGTVASIARAAATVPFPTVTAVGGSTVVAHIPMPTVEASGVVGMVGDGTITMPLPTVMASGTAHTIGSATITIPLPSMGTIGRAVVAIPAIRVYARATPSIGARSGYALNLLHNQSDPNSLPMDELTTYSHYTFSHIVRFNGRLYGINSTGLYLLEEGDTDDGIPIGYRVVTGKTDFGAPENKRFLSMYLSGRIGAQETMTLFVGERDTQPRQYQTPRGTDAQNYRQRFGMGNAARYYAVGIEGFSAFRLDTLDCETVNLTRRI